MRCAAIHRKLGTHVSKVKSLSMDSWSNEQVEVCILPSQSVPGRFLTVSQNMKQMGNTASNLIYNPKNMKPPVPFDADEADSAMERFIRMKYRDSEALSNYENSRDYDTAPSRRESETSYREAAPRRHQTMPSPDIDEHPLPPPPKTSRFGFRSASSIFPMSSKAKREAAARQFLENQRQ